MRPSTSKLSTFLTDFGAATSKFSTTAVRKERAPMANGWSLSDETYGKDSRIYIYTPDLDARMRLQNYLVYNCNVTTVNRGYHSGANVVEVGVTYFKGNNWDE